jgi:DNA-binding MarR family transcriptional regulator
MSKPLFPTRSGVMARLGTAFLTWRRYLQRGLAPYGITLKQQHLLRELDQVEYLYPSDIAEMLFCDRPTATVVLDNLAKQGWIRRERDPENRKFMRISITPAGRQKLAELSAVQWGDFDPLAAFTDEELQQFDTLLRKLKKHLAQIESLPEREDGD